MRYLMVKILYILKGRKMEVVLNFLRNSGMKIGEGCMIYSNIITSESYLISIGKHTTISNNVQLITHDNSICKVNSRYTDIFGKIEIGENCFIGAQTIILPGVSLASNIIVGAGSVVTKSFDEENIIIAGNPATIISSWESLRKKTERNTFNIDNLNEKEKERLIKRNEKKYIKR